MLPARRFQAHVRRLARLAFAARHPFRPAHRRCAEELGDRSARPFAQRSKCRSDRLSPRRLSSFSPPRRRIETGRHSRALLDRRGRFCLRGSRAGGHGTWTIPLTSALSLALSAAPGLYAALDGLRGRLDVARQAQRSGRIAAGLRRLARELADAPPSAALARAAALRAANIMGEDVCVGARGGYGRCLIYRSVFAMSDEAPSFFRSPSARPPSFRSRPQTHSGDRRRRRARRRRAGVSRADRAHARKPIWPAGAAVRSFRSDRRHVDRARSSRPRWRSATRPRKSGTSISARAARLQAAETASSRLAGEIRRAGAWRANSRRSSERATLDSSRSADRARNHAQAHRHRKRLDIDQQSALDLLGYAADRSFIGNRHYSLANVVRASTAAPHFSIRRRSRSRQGEVGLFVDGGLTPHNNPSLVAASRRHSSRPQARLGDGPGQSDDRFDRRGHVPRPPEIGRVAALGFGQPRVARHGPADQRQPATDPDDDVVVRRKRAVLADQRRDRRSRSRSAADRCAVPIPAL